MSAEAPMDPVAPAAPPAPVDAAAPPAAAPPAAPPPAAAPPAPAPPAAAEAVEAPAATLKRDEPEADVEVDDGPEEPPAKKVALEPAEPEAPAVVAKPAEVAGEVDVVSAKPADVPAAGAQELVVYSSDASPAPATGEEDRSSVLCQGVIGLEGGKRLCPRKARAGSSYCSFHAAAAAALGSLASSPGQGQLVVANQPSPAAGGTQVAAYDDGAEEYEQCAATTLKGYLCQHSALKPSKYCGLHQRDESGGGPVTKILWGTGVPCSGKNNRGTPCQLPRVGESTFCQFHARSAAAEGQPGGTPTRAGRSPDTPIRWCEAVTARGLPCQLTALAEIKFCHFHSRSAVEPGQTPTPVKGHTRGVEIRWCAAETARGTPCQLSALTDNTFCHFHTPTPHTPAATRNLAVDEDLRWCEAVTVRGLPCQLSAVGNSKFCRFHARMSPSQAGMPVASPVPALGAPPMMTPPAQ